MPGTPIYEDWWTGDWWSFEELPHPCLVVKSIGGMVTFPLIYVPMRHGIQLQLYIIKVQVEEL